MKLDVIEFIAIDDLSRFIFEAAQFVPSKILIDPRPERSVYTDVQQNEEDNKMHFLGSIQSSFQLFWADTLKVTRRDCFSY